MFVSEDSNEEESNNVIKLIQFGKEDINHFTDKEICTILNKGFNAVVELLLRLNFNPNKPEYHNIYKTYLRDGYITIYDGTRWIVVRQKKLIKTIIKDRTKLLIDKYNELKHKIKSRKGLKKLTKFRTTSMLLLTSPVMMKEVEEDIKLIAYNNKHIVLKTK